MQCKQTSPSSSILGRTEPRTTLRSFHEDFPDTENPLNGTTLKWFFPSMCL